MYVGARFYDCKRKDVHHEGVALENNDDSHLQEHVIPRQAVSPTESARKYKDEFVPTLFNVPSSTHNNQQSQ